MFPFELTLFGTGLMIIVTVLVVLYIVVLVKLNPSTEGERIPKKDVTKKRILEEPLTERQVKTATFNKIAEEPPEPIERQEPVSPAPVETEKTGAQYCSHHLGYLAKHPKHTPMPNECLTCTKIMECLSKGE